jgi:Calx-beta domain
MSWLPRGAVSGVVACLALLGAERASAQGTVTIIDSSAGVGENVSLAVTPAGSAFVAYYDGTNGDLKLARCLDAACTSASVAALDATGDVGFGADLTIGADGRAVVSYADRTNASVKIAHCDDAACTTATTRVVDPVALGSRSAIVTGSDGLPLVVYVAGSRLKAVHCSVADCSAWTVSDLAAVAPSPVALAVGADGRGTIEQGGMFFPRLFHCTDVPCSAVALDAPASLVPQSLTSYSSPTLGRLGDGRLLQNLYVTVTDITGQYSYLVFSRCNDAACFSQTALDTRPAAGPETAISSLPDGRGLFAYREGGQVHVRSCSNADCTSWTESCTLGSTNEFEVAAAADAAPLVAFHRDGGGVGVAHAPADACGQVTVSVFDSFAFEPEGQMEFTVSLTAPAQGGEAVGYQTKDGTAVAGADYVATSGILTFAPGQLQQTVTVPVLSDVVSESDETFALELTVVGGVLVGDGYAVGTIGDGAPVPRVVAGDCQTLEGDSGVHGCVFPVELTPIAGTSPVTVDFATADGSAAAGPDYVAASGTLTFAPGTTSLNVSVSVVGDTVPELDEVFFLRLSNPTNAVVLDGEGTGGIVDDDAVSLSSLELTHGAIVTADLAAQPGPAPDTDYYRVGQTPYSSYEAVADAVSGDAAPGLALDLLAEDNTTVIAQSQPVGIGSAVALRWVRLGGGAETRDTIRVGGASCGTGCGPDDTYRLRFYETTATIPRFNNTATQVTVLILQNTTDDPQDFWMQFWDASGQLLRSLGGNLFARQTLVFNTASVPEVGGHSGSITIAGFGAYGALAGKAVALEPATGFSFDSPLSYKPR